VFLLVENNSKRQLWTLVLSKISASTLYCGATEKMSYHRYQTINVLGLMIMLCGSLVTAHALNLPIVSGMTAHIGGTTVTTKRARASHNYRRRIRRNSAAIVRQPPVTARSLTPAPVQVIPPAQPADYLSGQARVTVRGNEDPVVRVGLAQHGPVIIEFPVADSFFAVHPGGSQVVTFDESPTLATDHYLVFRVGTNFALAAENTTVRAEARASVSVQMQSGLFVTFLFYPVKDVSRMAHRVVVMYGRDEVVAARRAAGLAVNLDNKTPPASAAPSITSRRVNNAHHRAGSHEQSQSEDEPHTNEGRDVRSGVTLESSELATSTITTKRRFNRSINLQREAQKALREALASPTRFNRWSAPKHGLSIAALAPVDLDATRRLTVVAAKNVTPSGLRVLAGSPEIDLQTLNDAGQIVQVRSITRLHREASTLDGAIPAGATIYYVVIYETPVLDAAQRVRLSIAQINAADQPASTEVSGADQ